MRIRPSLRQGTRLFFGWEVLGNFTHRDIARGRPFRSALQRDGESHAAHRVSTVPHRGMEHAAFSVTGTPVGMFSQLHETGTGQQIRWEMTTDRLSVYPCREST